MLDHGVFKELRDKSYFKQVRAEHGSIAWPPEPGNVRPIRHRAVSRPVGKHTPQALVQCKETLFYQVQPR
ncbi:MAG: DUF2442 domain-containing protein [Chlorobiaceae bacterium]|nr:DUF2442 domain-containing protein [Chlorobiaceae bacterium]